MSLQNLEQHTKIVIRPIDWNQLDEILEFLWNNHSGYEPLCFGCISISKNGADLLRSRGYELEEVNFDAVLHNQEEQHGYVAQRDEYYGLKE